MNKKNWLRGALAALLIPAAAYAATTTFQTDTAKLGRPNSNNKDFIFDLNLGASNPRLRANGTTSKLQFTNDGTIYSDVGSGAGGGGVGTNFLSDSNGQSFPSGSAWTVTSGTGSADTSVYTDGLQSMKVTASSQTSKLSQDVTPTADMSGQNWQATMWVKTSLTNVQVCARVATVATNCQAVASNNSWAPYTATFIGPASGSVGVEVSMTGSGTGSFNAQLGYVGKATSLSMVNANITDWQAYTPTFGAGFGTVTNIAMYYRRVADTEEVQGTFTIGTHAASLGTITLGGGVSIDTTKLPATNNVSSSVVVGYATAPVANEFAPLVASTSSSASVVYVGTVISVVNSLTPTNIDNVFQSSVVVSVHFKVPVQGWGGSSPQQGFRPDATPVSWSGKHAGISGGCSASGSAYTDFSACTGITLTELTNRNLGTVTTAGSSLPGITFTPPRSGRYLISAVPTVNLGSGTGVSAFRLTDGTTAFAYSQASLATSITSTALQGVYNATAGSSTTIKIQVNPNASTTNISETGLGTPDIVWSIVELDAPLPAPYLVGSVTSNTSAQEHMERAKITNGGSCAVSSQSGSWISSVSHPASGQCTLNFTTGEWSAAPACVVSNSGSNGAWVSTNSASSSTVTVLTQDNGGPLDRNFDIICMGPR